MATIAIKKVNFKTQKNNPTLLSRYNAFCKRQENARVLWYLIPLMSLSAAVMPITIIAVYYLASTTAYLNFVAFSILAFYANLISTIGEFSIKTSITTYFLTVLIHVLVPILFLIAYLN